MNLDNPDLYDFAWKSLGLDKDSGDWRKVRAALIKSAELSREVAEISVLDSQGLLRTLATRKLPLDRLISVLREIGRLDIASKLEGFTKAETEVERKKGEEWEHRAREEKERQERERKETEEKERKAREEKERQEREAREKKKTEERERKAQEEKERIASAESLKSKGSKRTVNSSKTGLV